MSVFAERGGFEPPIRFWRIHAFQACLFNHSSTFPHLGYSYSGAIYNIFCKQHSISRQK